MKFPVDVKRSFTVKQGTIESTLNSSENNGFHVLSELNFTDGDGFLNVAADDDMHRFLATDRSGKFIFYNAWGRGVLVAADIYGVGMCYSRSDIWLQASRRKTAQFVALMLPAALALGFGAYAGSLWLVFLGLALSAIWLPLAFGAARCVAIAEAVKTVKRDFPGSNSAFRPGGSSGKSATTSRAVQGRLVMGGRALHAPSRD